MANGAEGKSCAQRCRKRRWLFRALLISVLGVYIASEWSLRHLVYGKPEASSLQELLPVAERLPVLFQEPIKNWIKAADVEERLVGSQGAERRKLLYELAALRSGSRQRKVYQAIIETFPDDPEASLAWTLLLRQEAIDDPLASYLAYVERVKQQSPRSANTLWVTGWGAFSTYPEEVRRKYLRILVDENVAHAGLVDAYEKLKRDAMLEEDQGLRERAERLYERSRELWLAEQERMMEGG